MREKINERTTENEKTMKCNWCPQGKKLEAEYIVVLGNLDEDVWDIRLCTTHTTSLNSCRKMITETKTSVPVTDHGHWKFADDWITQPL